MATIDDIDSFSLWISEIVKTSEHVFVKSGPEMISYFFQLEKEFPDEYGWRYYDVDSFKSLVEKNNKSPNDINKIYWRDVIRTLEAYGVITYFRTNEILRTAIRSLNNKEIVPAAVLTRSLLELACTMIENSNVFSATVNSLTTKPNTVTIGSDEFEKLLVRIIWGTRLGEDIPEYLKQKNILTTIQKLSKNPNAVELIKKYEYLCELAHPNFIGNARFWSDDSKSNNDGSITISIKKRGYFESKKEIVENVVWALGWSAACLRNGYHLLQDAILKIDEKFPGTVDPLKTTLGGGSRKG